MLNRCLEKRERPLAADAGQDNQTGVNGFRSDERAKITRVFGNDDKFTSNTSLQHTVVGVSTPSKIQRMLSNVLAVGIQFTGDLRRQALINKQTACGVRTPGAPHCARAARLDVPSRDAHARK